MTITQEKAIEDLELIIKNANELIHKLKIGEIDNIESETLKAYLILSDLFI